MPNLRLLVLAFQLRDAGSILSDFMMDKVELEQFFLSNFPLLFIVPPFINTHLLPPHEVCNSSDQTAHYYSSSPKLGASSLA
jgi:hypothetical protein